jgi:hypothetical protein
MTSIDEGVQYTELFGVIRQYARFTVDDIGDRPKKDPSDFHNKALGLIADNYTPYGKLPMAETPELVQEVLEHYNYLFFWGGRPSLIGLEPIATIATWNPNRKEWALQMLNSIENALRKADSQQVSEKRFWIRTVRREKQRIELGNTYTRIYLVCPQKTPYLHKKTRTPPDRHSRVSSRKICSEESLRAVATCYGPTSSRISPGRDGDLAPPYLALTSWRCGYSSPFGCSSELHFGSRLPGA